MAGVRRRSRVILLNQSQGGMYIYGAMRIGWGAPGEFFYPHLEDRPASPFDLSPLPISVCTFHLGFSLVRMRGIHRRNPADHHRHLNAHPTLDLV